MTALADDLSRPEAYPSAPSRIERVETHISWVFLTDDEAFKVKKPVDFGFLDFRTLAARRAACEAELRLNARLAEGVYRGLVPVRRDAEGRHALGEGPGEIVDWAVRMRRLPDARRADLMLARGELGPSHVDRIAERIAKFHAACPANAETARFGMPEAISTSVEENFRQVGPALADYVAAGEATEIQRAQRADLAARRATFERRAADGRVRDGHGDLRLEHVYFEDDGSVCVIDCIEFNDRFRFGDVAGDVAFLSMDLMHSGAVDLAERLLARYARAASDYDLYEVVDFYEGYRAFVRGKIAHFMATAPGVADATRAQAVRQARSYFLLSLSTDRRALLAPSLVCIGGIIASGKSTLAEALSGELGAPIVDADRTRKHMLGVAATAPVHTGAWSGAYDPALTDRVYDEVFRRARVVLASGRPAIVDASFRSARFRSAARALARELGVPFCFVECKVTMDVARARLAERATSASVSDGRLEVLDDFVARFEPVTELGPGEHLVLDASAGLDAELASVRARVATWPRGLVA